MKTNEVVRAWKDEDYRETLTPEYRATLPQHPSGLIEFDRPELDDESYSSKVESKHTATRCFGTKHC
jgi:mersacidin/lichenicidin family type 2 lantibiotic